MHDIFSILGLSLFCIVFIVICFDVITPTFEQSMNTGVLHLACAVGLMTSHLVSGRLKMLRKE